MNKNQFRIIVLVSAFIMGGCWHIAKNSRREELLGINGKATYVFRKDNSIWGLYKMKYYTKEYQIIVLGDTIERDSSLQVLINVVKSDYKITITKPSTYEIVNDGPNKGLNRYNFKPERAGTFDFEGRIEYDTTVIPFDYKFIVVQ